MGQTAQLRLIRDGFIAGHNSCDLRRHLDRAPPDTPIRDVVDRCRVWESHADPAINWMRKPTTDPLYPTFTVGGAESNYDITKVDVVTEPKSDRNKLVDVIRRTLANTEIPNPEPEIPDILEWLQQLLRESVPNTLKQTLESLFDGRRPRQRQPPRLRQQRRDMTGVICFSCGRPGHTTTCCLYFNEKLPTIRMANGGEARRSYDITATGINRPPAGGKRWMIREDGSTSQVSINAWPQDPGAIPRGPVVPQGK